MNTTTREHDIEYSLLGFQVGLTFQTIDSHGKAIYNYTVVTPTGVTFHNQGLGVPSGLKTERIAAEAIFWVCVGRDSGVDDDFWQDMDAYQLTWVDSLNREYAANEIDEWMEHYDRTGGEIMNTTENTNSTPIVLDIVEHEEPDSIDRKIQRRAEEYIEQYVHANQTSLVEHLLQADDGYLSYDDVVNLEPDVRSMDISDLCELLEDELGVDWRDLIVLDDYADAEEDSTEITPDDLSRADVRMLEKYAEANLQPKEVLEWYLVDSFLANELEESGEVIASDGRNRWWGRCTTGQYIIHDGVMQRIAAKYIRDVYPASISARYIS